MRRGFYTWVWVSSTQQTGHMLSSILQLVSAVIFNDVHPVPLFARSNCTCSVCPCNHHTAGIKTVGLWQLEGSQSHCWSAGWYGRASLLYKVVLTLAMICKRNKSFNYSRTVFNVAGIVMVLEMETLGRENISGQIWKKSNCAIMIENAVSCLILLQLPRHERWVESHTAWKKKKPNTCHPSGWCSARCLYPSSLL